MKGASGARAVAGVRHHDAPGLMPVNTAANSAYGSTGDLLSGAIEARLAHSVADGFRHRYEGGAGGAGPG